MGRIGDLEKTTEKGTIDFGPEVKFHCVQLMASNYLVITVPLTPASILDCHSGGVSERCHEDTQSIP